MLGLGWDDGWLLCQHLAENGVILGQPLWSTAEDEVCRRVVAYFYGRE
jgi:hypothetical protein